MDDCTVGIIFSWVDNVQTCNGNTVSMFIISYVELNLSVNLLNLLNYIFMCSKDDVIETTRFVKHFDIRNGI